MTVALQRFIKSCRSVAEAHGLRWNPPHDDRGQVDAEFRWNISKIVGSPTQIWLGNFGWPKNMLETLVKLGDSTTYIAPNLNHLDPAWKEFCQAAVVDFALIQKRAPHGIYNRVRFLKITALASWGTPPENITGDQIRRAYNIALLLNDSEAARIFPGMVRSLFDTPHHAARPNLASCCTPYARPETQSAQTKVDAANSRSRAKGYTDKGAILDQLHDRKDALKLPDTKAFWELCRIVFTVEPQTLHDLQLFACARLHVITGLRSAEITLLPLDWMRWREWTDIEGSPAGARGGISRSLAIRHFAGKQANRARRGEKRNLVPKLQDVPEMFEDIVLMTLHEVEQANSPLRKTFKSQIENQRLFPDLDPSSLIPVWEAYSRIYGNSQISDVTIPEELAASYRSGIEPGDQFSNRRFDPIFLEPIRRHQLDCLGLMQGGPTDLASITGTLSTRIHGYFSERKSRASFLTLRDSQGAPMVRDGRKWTDVCVRVSDLEEGLRERGWYSIFAADALSVEGEGPLLATDFLFLTSIRKGGSKGRDILDVGKMSFIRRFNTDELGESLGNKNRGTNNTIFSRYGESDDTKLLTMDTHPMRHLQNTELFRKGVSDAIITKRFNRTSVQQSYVYDHRSLVENLDAIKLPSAQEEKLGAKASTTYKLIISGSISGPIVQQFRAIQKEEGDDAAFDFLIAEADGLHATPYGFCLNSFTVDPCPKHLECFNGCLHLARSDLPAEQIALVELRDRTAKIVEKIEGAPEGSVGRRNQLAHANIRLANLDKAISTRAGKRVFPDGRDLSLTIDTVLGNTVLDAPIPAFVSASATDRKT